MICGKGLSRAQLDRAERGLAVCCRNIPAQRSETSLRSVLRDKKESVCSCKHGIRSLLLSLHPLRGCHFFTWCVPRYHSYSMMTFWFVGYKVVCIINNHNIYTYYMTYPVLPTSIGSIIGRQMVLVTRSGKHCIQFSLYFF